MFIELESEIITNFIPEEWLLYFKTTFLQVLNVAYNIYSGVQHV